MGSGQKSILVTGGAGYIGSHCVKRMHAQELPVVVLDNLVYGHRKAVDPAIPFFQGNVGDRSLLERIFKEHDISAVMHFAAYAYVGESVTNPAKYYQNNTAEPIALLDAMHENNCHHFIFSSTCATYGNPVALPMDESHPQNPINPYGQSKLMLERILGDYQKAYGMRHAILRYFNASGAAEDGSIGEDHHPETHLIPLVLMAAAGQRESITVFGTDYDTPDGTCIRDYIHILDLAEAHVMALEYLQTKDESLALNLGTGKGVSVKEILMAAEKVTGKKVPTVYGDRRAGDPPELVANPELARSVLNWEAKYKDVEETIATAWKWMTGSRKGRF